MNILVNGIGNIGQTLLAILSDYQSLLKIDKIYALKNTEINSWNKNAIDILASKGVVICTKIPSEYESLDNVINTIDYVFDCNANSFGLKNKEWYDSLLNLKGASAQGSEKNFGTSFMTGINNEIIKNEKFAHIVSCNTHSLSSIVSTFTNHNYRSLTEGDFVVVRRSEDIGNKERLVGANVVSRHINQEIGTHHAIDVKDLFTTKNITLNVQSSDITTPSQLMHTVRFNLQFEEMPTSAEIEARVLENKFISTTAKFDSNLIFELGRRYSPYGRLFSHTIINLNNLLFDYSNKRIKGWAFIPQEGNTILSTIHAFLLQTGSINDAKIIAKLQDEMMTKNW